MRWAAEFDIVPASVTTDVVAMLELAEALTYYEHGAHDDGPDGILSFGETMRTGPQDSGGDSGTVLYRLPRGVADLRVLDYWTKPLNLKAFLAGVSALARLPVPDDKAEGSSALNAKAAAC